MPPQGHDSAFSFVFRVIVFLKSNERTRQHRISSQSWHFRQIMQRNIERQCAVSDRYKHRQTMRPSYMHPVKNRPPVPAGDSMLHISNMLAAIHGRSWQNILITGRKTTPPREKLQSVQNRGMQRSSSHPVRLDSRAGDNRTTWHGQNRANQISRIISARTSAAIHAQPITETEDTRKWKKLHEQQPHEQSKICTQYRYNHLWKQFVPQKTIFKRIIERGHNIKIYDN